MFSADSIAILFLHSIVNAALCGDSIILSKLNKGLTVAGSFLKTSKAAPFIKLCSNAIFKSFSSIKFPLAVLIRKQF